MNIGCFTSVIKRRNMVINSGYNDTFFSDKIPATAMRLLARRTIMTTTDITKMQPKIEQAMIVALDDIDSPPPTLAAAGEITARNIVL